MNRWEAVGSHVPLLLGGRRWMRFHDHSRFWPVALTRIFTAVVEANANESLDLAREAFVDRLRSRGPHDGDRGGQYAVPPL
ncbi:MAG TPA: hypothetical protein VGG74_19220 [Kofleriaceae bacterium]